MSVNVCVVFQCFTHRYLGWKINVVDECDAVEGEESRVISHVASPPPAAEDAVPAESIQVHSRLASDDRLHPRKKIEKIINTKTNYDNFSSTSGLTGELYTDDRNVSEREIELPISSGQIEDVILAVENIENKMKNEIEKNMSSAKPLNQYQVHEDTREMFIPEQPIREDDEYVVEAGKVPEPYFLPPNQKPLTLQSVLRPNGPKPSGNMRPPFRRPAPPEIKLRRPPPMFQKNNGGYPLPLPNLHTMQKIPIKYLSNRYPPNMNRLPMGNIPPMKSMPPLHQKPFNAPPPFNPQKPPPKQNGPVQSIIMGKPIQSSVPAPSPTKSQTLSLGQTDIIANQVVKSQITLPGANDVIGQHNTPQIFFKPGQIILGKPMDHPVPLDQQMIQNKPQMIRTPPTSPPHLLQSTTLRIKLNNEYPIQNEIKSSDFLGESTETSTLKPAVNTGFKPDSIVVESGFKPIIREPLMAVEDRITDYDGITNVNRREDTDVEEDYDESPQPITNHANPIPSEQLTETFEPMFIPSPPDHLLSLPIEDKTKEVFPSNHAKEDRPHPVYVKTESELNALFSKNNMDKDVPDMVMESDKVSPHYLPPDPKLPNEHSQKILNEQTFTTYDGKTVSAATLTSVPDVNKTTTKLFSSKLPANSELLLKMPQFGPFKGEIPPPVDTLLAKDGSMKLTDLSDKSTTLKLVNLLHTPDEKPAGDLKPEGSEISEVMDILEDEEYEGDEEEEEEEDPKKRSKRESKTTQFERGEVEAVQTNGHSLVRQVDYGAVNAATDSTRRRTTHLVLLTMLLQLF